MRKIIDFNKNWQFHKGDVSFDNLEEFLWEEISLPHTYNNLDGQDGGNDYYKGVTWYRKKLGQNIIPDGYDKDVYIRFGAASKKADVYVNGELAASHEGGFSAFTISLTGKLTDSDNEILVKVDNSAELPIYPMFADFTFFGGLYREVSLICFDCEEHFKVDEYGVDALLVTPDVSGKVLVKTKIHGGEDKNLCCKVRVCEALKKAHETDEDDKTSKCVVTKIDTPWNITSELTIESPKLWDGLKTPFLYNLEIQLLSENSIDDLSDNAGNDIDDSSNCLDRISTTFGFRSFKVDADTGFFLNGRSYPLHGVCRHQDRENMGWAITSKEHDEDMELIKEIGANTVRLAHYQQAPYFYDLCDKNGFIVWAEIPFISKYDERPKADDNLRSQLKELIMQNYNHPSICFWGIANETGMGGECDGMYKITKELNSIAKELDSTRLTTIANIGSTTTDSPLFHSTDITTYNEYKGWYEGSYDEHGDFCDEKHAELGNIPLGISEYGADAVLKWHSASPRVKDYTEEYQAILHEKAITAFNERKYLFGTWLWNMFDFGADNRDEGGSKGRNNKGLVTYDRKIKKQAFYLYKALWSDDPFVYVCGKRFTKRCEDKIDIKVYSNCQKVQLFINGELFEEKQGKAVFVFENVTLSEKNTEIVAKGKNTICEDFVVIEKVSQCPDEYIFKEEKNVSESVAQWFAGLTDSENSHFGELTVKEGFLSVYDPMEEVYRYKEGFEVMQELVAKPLSLIKPDMAERMKTGGAMSFHNIWNHISKMLPDDLIYVVNERLNSIKKN